MKSIVKLDQLEPRDESQSKHDWVYQSLSESLLNGEFVPGISVTLRGIGEQLGVSAMPVREAIRRLVAEGALEVLSNRRVSVAVMSKARINELRYARLAIEPELAALALPQMKQSAYRTLKSLDESLNQAIDSGDVDAYIKTNRLFHFGIYQRANSPVLFPLVKSLWLQFAPFTRIVFGRVGTDTLEDYHLDALNALKNKDSKQFRRAIHADIDSGMQILMERL